MLNRSASVDFTADVGQYTQSLTQAIAVTQQYSKAADTLLGKIANLGGSMSNALVQKTAALTQANKTATAQAAAYQQQLSKIETTSKVLGDKTFPQLERATKNLAAQFPIGIGQAVQQMQSLQESGVTQIKTVEKLAVTYTKLGAATNTYGPVVGKQMTELTRSMGNSLVVVEGMGDSLTLLTKKFGGTAEGVLAFSKSIAPIAATVGMNQTQVMGLSTAFSRLGEDGFAAGNALNKVLLDLNRSVRDGTPELRQYAQVMNKSIEGLREQFTSDPTSVLIDFTETINRLGPNAIRTLESLGLEGVRTTKALTSLSREGNLGQIIEESSAAFGGGAMGKAAETAMGGVNDQIQRLNETMAQSAAAAGKPFLNMMESVLKTANSIAGAFNDVVSSDFMQKVGGVGQVAGGALNMAGSMAFGAVNTAMTVGMARKGFGAIRNVGANYAAGRAAGVAANLRGSGKADLIPDGWEPMPGADTMAGRAGQRSAISGGLTDAALLTAGVGMPRGMRGRFGQVGRASFNLASNTSKLAALATASEIGSSIGYARLSSEGGQALRTAFGEAAELSKAGDIRGAQKKLAPALEKLAREMTENGEEFGKLRTNLGNLTRRTGQLYVQTGKDILTSSIGSVGMKAGLVGAAAVGVGMVYNAVKENREETAARVGQSATDPYRVYNEFAEKAGLATKAITDLGDAASVTVRRLLSEENKNTGDWATLNAREYEASQQPGYTPAFQMTGKGAKADAVKALLMNPTMGEDALSRIVMDIASQGKAGAASAFVTEVQGMRSSAGSNNWLWSQLVSPDTKDTSLWGRLKGNSFRSDAEIERIGQVSDSLVMRRSMDTQMYGSTEAAKNADTRLEEMFNAAAASKDRRERSMTTSVLAGMTGIKASDIEKAYGGTFNPKSGEFMPGKGVSWNELMFKQAKSTNPATVSAYDDYMLATGRRVPSLDTAENQNEVASRESDKKINKALDSASDSIIDLTKVMREGNVLAAKNGKQLSELNASDMAGMSKTGRLLAASQQTPGDQGKAVAAGEQLFDYLFGQTKSGWKSQFALQQRMAIAPEEEKPAIQAAMAAGQYNVESVNQRTNMSPIQSLRDRISFGNATQAAGIPDAANPVAVQNYISAVQDRAKAIEEYKAVVLNTAKQVRDTMIQMDRNDEMFGRQQVRARRDFNRQISIANKDHERQEKYARADFRRQQQWSEEDYNRQRLRSAADYSRQVAYAEADYQRNRARIIEDVNLSVTRAEEDYQTSRRRATESFNRSQERASEDFATNQMRAHQDYAKSMMRANVQYLISRNRAFADYDRDLARQIEDNAKSMYDPYTRAMHERVWDTRQLLGNVLEQNEILAKQMAQVDALKGMGLSQAAVDLFGLADPAKAQQLFKTYADVLSNPALIQQLNDAVQGRLDLSSAFSTDTDNVGFRRASEDFARAMDRMAEDHQRSMDMAAEDFATSVKRAVADNAKAMKRAREDFDVSMTQMAENLMTSLKRVYEDMFRNLRRYDEEHAVAMARSAEEYALSMAIAAQEYDLSVERTLLTFDTTMKRMDKEFATSVANSRISFNTQMADSKADYETARTNMLEDVTRGVADLNKSYNKIVSEALGLIAEMPTEYADPLGDAFRALDKELNRLIRESNKEREPIKLTVQADIDTRSAHSRQEHSGGGGDESDEPHIEDGKVSGHGITQWTGGKGRPGATWYQSGNWTWAGGHHNGVDVVGVGYGTRVMSTQRGRIIHSGPGGPEGGWAGKNVIQDVGDAELVFAHLNSTNVSKGAMAGPGSVLGLTGNTGRSFGAHLHVSARKGGTYVDPRKYLAEGAIVQQPTDARIAEAGYPEAVLPLNERGANFLKQLIGRYVDNDEAQLARATPYATSVTVNTYHYDQSTKITGPVTVETSDPTDFARQMAAKARRDRLAQTASTGR